jgi:HEAT repeat protein
VVTALSAALEDQDPEVCAAAALSLGGLGDAARPAVGVLRRIADHRDEELRSAALAALACIEP